MQSVLLKKLVGLGRDEDGAALVITLALFMFLYAACAGVFAIGQSVKDKIHLQNACDAAAYSAAVVQADTLSRIATINRAMSWTYVSLCRREMDYITYRWLDHTLKHYDEDAKSAKAGGGSISSSPSYSKENRVKLCKDKDDKNPSRDDVDEAKKGFLREKLSHESFYSGTGSEIEVLERQIREDKKTIAGMGQSIDELIKNMPDRIVKSVKSMRGLNMPSSVRWRGLIRVGNNYFEQPEESRFVEYCGKGWSVSASWYDLGKGKAPDGIWREYTKDILRSDWYWWIKDIYGGRQAAMACPHSCSDHVCVDGVEGGGEYRHAWLTAGALRRVEGLKQYFTGCEDGKGARPRQLNQSYFSTNGTITVWMATYNENPWAVIFRRVPGYMSGSDTERNRRHGIYGLFNPYRYVRWSWAVSAAKAGYQHRDDPDSKDREYRVDYNKDKAKKWNLCTSDWDAVFVPVRRSHSLAITYDDDYDDDYDKAVWENTGREDFLGDFIAETGDPLGEDVSGLPPYNIVGNMPDLPLMHNGRGLYRNLDWSKLSDLMFH